MSISRSPLAYLLLSLLTAPIPAQAVHWVGPGSFATIQAAIDAAAPGDVVLIEAGVYPAFHVGKPLTITAAPSALVQIVTNGSVTFTLLPMDRVHLGGLDIAAESVTVTGGIVSAERCTVRTDTGLRLVNAMAALRWSSAGATTGSGVWLQNAHLHASDSSFSTAAGGSNTVEHGAVKITGASACELSLCTLAGAWPATAAAPYPSVPLHATGILAAAERVWLVDCTLLGGFLPGLIGPTIVTPPLPAPVAVRLHRCQLFGAALGPIGFGSVVGLQTPVDMQIGATFTTRMRGDPGQLLLFYAGTNIFGPFPIPLVEQNALGFFDTVISGALVADAQGMADFPFAVPNNTALRHLSLWWRGLDLSTVPWQATAAFVTLVQ